MTMIEDLLKMRAQAALGQCPFCSNPTNHIPFRDSLSKKEASMSGICQSCQDDFFNPEEEK